MLRRAARSVTRPRIPKMTALQSTRPFSNYLVTPREFMQEFVNSIPLLSGRPEPESRIVPVCAAWFMPNDPHKRTGMQVYKEAHIPQARFFDIDYIKDDDSPYPHMLPSTHKYSSCCHHMGIKENDTLVVYDTAELGIFSAPRVAFTFRAFGHTGSVHVLNNFREYVRQGFPTVSGHPQKHMEAAGKHDYAAKPKFKPGGIARYGYMQKLADGEGDAVAIDARSKGRFDGTADEPRPGLQSGHMPRSLNLPFTELLDPQTKAFLPTDKLREVLFGLGINEHQHIVSSCGTGVTAAIVDTALMEIGFPQKQRKIYDGSWTEWAMRNEADDAMILKTE